jgi:hypothetical protein
MESLGLILLIFSLVLACIAAYRRPPTSTWVIHPGWLAVAFFIASLIFGGVSIHGHS